LDNFRFIESGLIFGIRTIEDLRKVTFTSDDFANFGSTFQFVTDHVDNYRQFPTVDLLMEKFPELVAEAKGVELQYALDEFRNQVIYRRTRDVIRGQQALLKENPIQALRNIRTEIDTLELRYDDDIALYDNGSLQRLEEYEQRAELRRSGQEILGIPVFVDTINKTGVGLMPGEMLSVFARPTVGKTWACVLQAVVAAKAGFKTLFITTEMPVKQINMRIDVVMAFKMGYNFSHRSLRAGIGLDTDKYAEFLQKLAGENLIMSDRIAQSKITIDGIASLVRKHKPDLLIIDGMQLVSPSQQSSAVWQRMHDLFYDVKTLCTVNDMAAMVSTQANRNAANVFDPPKPEEVAFGDALIQASDMAFSIAKVEDENMQRSFALQKYRDGDPPMEYVTFDWDVDRGRVGER
jgi:KaiC/GvpD/RAD55 family RecA-like ATPase|tara:strand:+ start:1295 stop:2515 length:1221 start_codon:yes stop_codon:yes gene_type:complete